MSALYVALFTLTCFIPMASSNSFPSITRTATIDTRLALPSSVQYPTITPSCPYDPPTTQAILQRRGYPRNSFTNIPAYTLLRDCAHICLDGSTGGNYAGIWDYANCNSDACACRVDNQPIVVRSLNSCIGSVCGTSDSVDYVGATSVYAIFCNSVTGSPTDVLPTASMGSTAPVATTAVETAVETVVETVTVRTSSSGGPNSEYALLLLMVSYITSTRQIALLIVSRSLYQRLFFLFCNEQSHIL